MTKSSLQLVSMKVFKSHFKIGSYIGTCDLPFSLLLLLSFFVIWGEDTTAGARGGGGVLGLMFAGYVPLASQSPYPIIVYFLANRRPHLSHFLENVIFAIPT